MSDQQRKPASEPSESREKWWIRQRDAGHIPKRFITLFPAPVSIGIIDRCTAALFPWSRHEYPGKMRLRAWLLGMANAESASRYARMRVTRKSAASISSKLRSKASELIALADEVEHWAGSVPRRDADQGTGAPAIDQAGIAPPVMD